MVNNFKMSVKRFKRRSVLVTENCFYRIWIIMYVKIRNSFVMKIKLQLKVKPNYGDN